MRIVSYNILNGGEDRTLVLGSVIADQQPDVVAIVEADHAETVERIARRLSMDFVHAAGASHGCALLSRLPILDSVNHGLLEPALTRSFLQASIQREDGTEWTIGVLHLPAHATEAAEDKRLAELNAVLRLTKPHRDASRPHLLCGDFNSNAPYQRINIERCKPRTQRDYQANAGHLPRRVIQTMLDNGYVDTYRVLHDEQRQLIGSFDTEHPGQRVDYIFAHSISPSTVAQAWVHRAGRSAEASDHFSVGVLLSGGSV